MLQVDELKVRIGLDSADGDDDELLKLLEREAVAHFERATNLYFGPVAAQVEYLSGGRRGVSSLRLRAPVVSLTSVEVLPVIGSTDWTSPWPLSSYAVIADERRLDLLGGYTFALGARNVRVTYQGGYARNQEPADVRGAVASIVAATYRQGRATASPVETASEQASAGLVVPADAAAVIKTWQRSPGT